MKKISHLMIVSLIIFNSPTLNLWTWDQFLVWNVGQGQWTTLITSQECLHFDMGGEFFPKAALRNHCSQKTNFLFLSHLDKDHIQFIPWGIKNLPRLCLWKWPTEILHNPEWKKKASPFLKNLTSCQRHQKPRTSKIFEWSSSISKYLNTKIRNELSFVYTVHWTKEVFLIPGDSTKSAEKFWATRIKSLKIKKLILGHHGSNTSTHFYLLNHLPLLRQAIASARKRRYGHPHPLVELRLKKQGAALLKTEDWGSLSFQIKD